MAERESMQRMVEVLLQPGRCEGRGHRQLGKPSHEGAYRGDASARHLLG